MAVSRDLQYLIDNVIFPPQLPQVDDDEVGFAALLELCLQCCSQMIQISSSGTTQSVWRSVQQSISTWGQIYRDGILCETKIAQAYSLMQIGGKLNSVSGPAASKFDRPADILLLYVRCQNASLLIRKTDSGTFFDCFEACPKTEETLAAKSALTRTFPARSIRVPTKAMRDAHFVKELSSAIHMLSVERLNCTAASTLKAGSSVVEERQSCHPRMVTEWLYAILLSQGEQVVNKTITKRTRDDVCWSNTRLPWRRSPFWLSIKVALQLAFFNSAAADDRHSEYKKFMLIMVAQVGIKALEAGVPSNLLHVVNIKLARRSVKLLPSAFEPVQQTVSCTINALRSNMEEDWAKIRAEDNVKIAETSNEVPLQTLLLSRSGKAILTVLDRSKTNYEYPAEAFNPESFYRAVLSRKTLPPTSNFEISGDKQLYCLVDFEAWVSDCLPAWLHRNFGQEKDCLHLKNLAVAYLRMAKPLYQGLPEQISLMVLTILDVWMALDLMASRLHPLLSSFSPEIPQNFLEPLLLPKISELHRLHDLEQHLQNRHTKAAARNDSIFGPLSANSFPVKFFDSSEELQALRRRIVDDAQTQRNAKKQEWTEKKAEYDRLVNVVISTECTRWTNLKHGYTKHDNKCKRCAIRKQADTMKIQKHEWPIPENDSACKAVIFELRPPVSITSWRDLTWLVLHDLGRQTNKKGVAAHQNLLNYTPLIIYQQHNGQRIELESTSKSFYKTHYKFGSPHAVLDRVLVNHAMQYQYYDNSSNDGIWVKDQDSLPSIQQYCSSKISDGRYAILQEAVNVTTQSQNRVIAQQAKCPHNLSIFEYVAFGSVRSGERIQWINILRELQSADINFNSQGALVLVEQVAWQAGSRLDGYTLREAHSIFNDSNFCIALIKILEQYYYKIETNWKEVQSAMVLVTLAKRLLSLAPFRNVVSRCLLLIRRLRAMALRWLQVLISLERSKRDENIEDQHADEGRHRVLDVALLCRSTWDVDPEHLRGFLETEEEVADFVECSIIAQDYHAKLIAKTTPRLKSDLTRDKKLGIRAAKIITDLLASASDGISNGIARSWDDVQFARTWHSVAGCDANWLINKTSHLLQAVHYHLVTGELLVAGRTMRQLPVQYTKKDIYIAVFGTRVLDVLLSDRGDMAYMTVNKFSGHRIYFGMRGDQLLIRSRQESNVFEVLPRRIFQGDLPTLVIEKTLPWINFNNHQIDFRSLEHPWQSDRSDWRMAFNVQDVTQSSMRNKRKHLLCHQSPFVKSVLSVFTRLEQANFIHVLWCTSKELEVELPRFRLHFFLGRRRKFVCRELSAYVDREQEIGTLHGLRHRLVLRGEGSHTSELSRLMLVPFGHLQIRPNGTHVSVHIDTSDKEKVRYFQYRLNSRLGQLTAENDLEAYLFKAYLHAVTSSHLPDSLTYRTGTEESLSALHDSAAKTSIPLSLAAQNILLNISKLTPNRSFYPRHLKRMQQVTWHESLSPLSQHDCFATLVQKILEHNQKSNFLFNGGSTLITPYSGHFGLLERSWARNWKLFPSTFTQFCSHSTEDLIYKSQEKGHGRGSDAAFELASLIQLWPSKLSVSSELYEMFCEWGEIGSFADAFQFPSFGDLLDLDISGSWAALYSLCRQSNKTTGLYRLMFVFSTIAFGNPNLLGHLRTLLAFAFNDRLKSLIPPAHDTYDLRIGHAPDYNEVNLIVKQYQTALEYQSISERERQREEIDHAQEIGRQRKAVVDCLAAAWPNESLVLPPADQLTLINLPTLEPILAIKFKAWLENSLFRADVKGMETVLELIHDENMLNLSCPPPIGLPLSGRDAMPAFDPSLLRLMLPVSASLLGSLDKWKTSADRNLEQLVPSRASASPETYERRLEDIAELDGIFQTMQEHDDSTARDYGTSLTNSLTALRNNLLQATPEIADPELSKLFNLRRSLQTKLGDFEAAIGDLLAPRTDGELMLKKAGLWPRITPLSLLQLLTARNRSDLPASWLAHIVAYGRLFTAAQRVERLVRSLENGDKFALRQELNNPAHEAWELEKYPDWLLLEIQNDLLIRPIQVRVAEELMSSESGVLQLGMGEGKSSVILPMIITASESREKLLRVVVLKPLANSMLSLLSHTLSGLCGREVYNLPFSRQTEMTLWNAEQYFNLLQQCQAAKGVLLTLPEHLNSFRLRTMESVTSPDMALAKKFHDTQQYLDDSAFDIFDECDELLGASYEMVYSAGDQHQLSGAPNRWLVHLEVLTLIKKIAPSAQSACPEGIEYESRTPDAFPHIRVLNEQGWEVLAEILLKAITVGSLLEVSLNRCSQRVFDAAIEFISKRDASEEAYKIIERHFKESAQLQSLYALRGLFGCKILPFVLGKRWLVNYGLDRTRCMSAVPYRAKAVPSASAEYSQPDVMLVLTALAYYFTGLGPEDMKDCVFMLLKMADPADEYVSWFRSSTLPDNLRSLNAVNPDDQGCLEELYTHLRFNKAVIDFFLRERVFPKEAREFTHKLSTSAWDLCSMNGQKTTGGFSGTMDTKALLPLSVRKKDLPILGHTSAKVLAALLQRENREYVCAAGPEFQRLSTDDLLRLIVRQTLSLCVLIDVGAQVLEDNSSVATKWLGLRQDREAVVFFSEKDELMVQDHAGNTDRLVASPYREKLGSCLILLDEAHSRGTDLNLPPDFRAAVTLGPGLTKDRFVQACMRMRKLGHGQSIVCFAPPEVDRNIRSLVGASFEDILSSEHVIRFTMNETISSIHKQLPLWVMKGLGNCKRRIANAAYASCHKKPKDRLLYTEAVREKESRPLEDVYEIVRMGANRLPYTFDASEREDTTVQYLLGRWEKLDWAVLAESGKTEEQERELMHEAEQVREVQRPSSQKACVPEVSAAIRGLVLHGTIAGNQQSLQSAFNVLRQTSAAKLFESNGWPNLILATKDFSQTVTLSAKSVIDEYLRPVNWILSSKRHKTLFLVSPHEANDLLPDIRKSSHVTLHVYSPRVSKSMAAFDQLDIYRIPHSQEINPPKPELQSLLNIFAGQLYFNNHQEYQYFCQFLGLLDGRRRLSIEQREVSSDGFVSPACRMANDWVTNFTKNPLPFVKEFFGMRRKGHDWLFTHIGRVVCGRILEEDEFV